MREKNNTACKSMILCMHGINPRYIESLVPYKLANGYNLFYLGYQFSARSSHFCHCSVYNLLVEGVWPQQKGYKLLETTVWQFNVIQPTPSRHMQSSILFTEILFNLLSLSDQLFGKAQLPLGICPTNGKINTLELLNKGHAEDKTNRAIVLL